MYLALLLLLAHQAAAEPASSELNVHSRMATHFGFTTAYEKAVIRGDLESARQAARGLRSLPDAGSPDAWQHWIQELDAFARMASQAESIEDAAQSLAALGEACASCHEPIGAGPALASERVPGQDWTGASHMSRHQWSATWMWLGVITPSVEAYRRGARSLAEQSLLEGASDPALPESAAGLDERIHAIGRQALTASDSHTRARLYGELLTTCGTCHRAMESEAPTP